MRSRYVGVRLTPELYEAAHTRAWHQGLVTKTKVTVSDVIRQALAKVVDADLWQVRVVDDASGKTVDLSRPMPQRTAEKLYLGKFHRLNLDRVSIYLEPASP